jgi:antitoxin (DNA-binding transcriptional repressor) of toxin-antitoxin stability system
MKTVDVDAPDTNLSQLVEEAAAGEEIIIAKDGKPLVKMLPLGAKKDIASTRGILKGQVWISDDFDAPLPPEILKSFGIEE